MKSRDMFLCVGLAVLWMLLSCLAPLSTAQSCYAEEGTDYEITCTTTPDIAREGLFWNVDAGVGPTRIAGCAGVGFCKTEDMYEDYVDVVLEDGKSILTIKDVSRSIPFKLERSKWICDWKEKNSTDTICSNLQVYVKPEAPVCEPPLLNTTTYVIQILCSTARVYPEVRCEIYLSKSGNESTFTRVTSTVSGIDTPLNETEEYFRSQCTILLPLGLLGSHGSYFQVRMYPRNYINSLSDAYSETAHINLAIINPSDENDDEEDDEIPYPIIVIVLGAVLGVTLIVAVVMGICMCKFRRKNVDQTSSHELQTGKAAGSYDTIGKRDSAQVNDNDGYYHDGQTQDDEDLYEN